MSSIKATIEKTAEMMMKKADDCLEHAKVEKDCAAAQHENASRMHAAADKQSASAKSLATLGRAIKNEAIDLQATAELHS